MSISNVPTLLTKIRTGAEGGHEFARLCKKLLASFYHGHYSYLDLADDSIGDFKKCDASLRLLEYGTSKEEIILFQFKFYPSPLSSNHKHSIKKSFIEAANENPNACKWVIITPEDLNKLDSKWLNQVVEDSKEKLLAPENAPHIEHWGHTRLINLLIQYKHIGIKYYPELFKQNCGFATIDNISINQNLCSWEMSEDDLTIYPKEIDFERFYNLDDKYGNDLILFEKLSKIDKQMFLVSSSLIEKRSNGKAIVPPETLYKGLISKILFSHDEEKLEFYKKDINVAEETLSRWWIEPEEFSRDIVKDKTEFQNLKRFHELFGKSTDPIINITFANRSSELVIVYNIGFKIVDVWQELGGLLTYATVVPTLADVVFEIEKDRKSWIKILDNAIQIPSNQAMTIKIRLKNYLKTYGVPYMVSGRFELGTSSDKVKSPTILFSS